MNLKFALSIAFRYLSSNVLTIPNIYNDMRVRIFDEHIIEQNYSYMDDHLSQKKTIIIT